MKKSLFIFRTESVYLLHRSKILLLMFLIVIFYESILLPMKNLSLETGLSLYIAEPFLLLCTHHTNIILIPTMYMLLLSDFPCSNTQYFHMIRTGKKNWFIGESLFVIITSFFVLSIILICSMLCELKVIGIGNGWSPYMLQMRQLFPDRYSENTQLFLDASVIAHGNSLNVLIYTFSAMWFYLIIIGMLLILGTILGKKLGFMIFSCILTIIGGTSLYFGGQAKWLFPISHLEFGLHFNSIFSKVDFPIIWSLLYISAIMIGIFMISLNCLKRMRIGEEQ